MTALETFISQAASRSRERTEPADCVLVLAPLMLDLIEHAHTFLQPQHYRSDTSSYARNLIYKASTKAFRSMLSSGFLVNGLLYTTTGVVASSALLKECSRSAATCGYHRTEVRMKVLSSCVVASSCWGRAR